MFWFFCLADLNYSWKWDLTWMWVQALALDLRAVVRHKLICFSPHSHLHMPEIRSWLHVWRAWKLKTRLCTKVCLQCDESGVLVFRNDWSLLHLYLCWTVVATLRETLQKLEVRVAVLEKSPAPTAVPCAQVKHKTRYIIPSSSFLVKVHPPTFYSHHPLFCWPIYTTSAHIHSSVSIIWNI